MFTISLFVLLSLLVVLSLLLCGAVGHLVEAEEGRAGREAALLALAAPTATAPGWTALCEGDVLDASTPDSGPRPFRVTRVHGDGSVELEPVL